MLVFTNTASYRYVHKMHQSKGNNPLLTFQEQLCLHNSVHILSPIHTIERSGNHYDNQNVAKILILADLQSLSSLRW